MFFLLSEDVIYSVFWIWRLFLPFTWNLRETKEHFHLSSSLNHLNWGLSEYLVLKPLKSNISNWTVLCSHLCPSSHYVLLCCYLCFHVFHCSISISSYLHCQHYFLSLLLLLPLDPPWASLELSVTLQTPPVGYWLLLLS